MNNIFVLCSGRCGSHTFRRACTHATNYKSGHESVCMRHGLDFPDNYIEVNNRLVWFMGLLDQKYPDARYVHLYRDPHEVAISHTERCKQPFQVAFAWRKAIRCAWHVKKGRDEERKLLTDCREFVDAINANIDVFLRTLPPTRYIKVDIDQPDMFQHFWTWAGLEGDIDEAMNTFKKRHNEGGVGRKRRAK